MCSGRSIASTARETGSAAASAGSSAAASATTAAVRRSRGTSRAAASSQHRRGEHRGLPAVRHQVERRRPDRGHQQHRGGAVEQRHARASTGRRSASRVPATASTAARTAAGRCRPRASRPRRTPPRRPASDATSSDRAPPTATTMRASRVRGPERPGGHQGERGDGLRGQPDARTGRAGGRRPRRGAPRAAGAAAGRARPRPAAGCGWAGRRRAARRAARPRRGRRPSRRRRRGGAEAGQVGRAGTEAVEHREPHGEQREPLGGRHQARGGGPGRPRPGQAGDPGHHGRPAADAEPVPGDREEDDAATASRPTPEGEQQVLGLPAGPLGPRPGRRRRCRRAGVPAAARRRWRGRGRRPAGPAHGGAAR